MSFAPRSESSTYRPTRSREIRPLSSITEPAPMAAHRAERGQALVIFALAIIVLLGMAAMVFDVGQTLLDRRAQQNASDAAALAGARHLGAGTCLTSPSLATCANAVAAAAD